MFAQRASRGAEAVIGIVRSDSLLLPVARLRDDLWIPLSREAGGENRIRLTPDAADLGTLRWTAYRLPALRPFPLRVRRVTAAESHCTHIEALETDAPASDASPQSWPKRKTAIALAGDAKVVPVEALQPPYDAAGRRARTTIRGVVRAIESERLEAASPVAIPRMTAAQRARIPVDVMTLVRGTADIRSAYYFEARKRYSTDVHLVVTGWVVLSDHDAVATKIHGVVTDRDYKMVRTATVLGGVTVGSRTVWVVNSFGYESEAYDLMELALTDVQVVLRVEGGGC